MKKIIKKILNVSLISGISGIVFAMSFYMITKAWNGNQAQPGDVLDSTKWNNMANSVSIPSGAVMAFNLGTCPDGRSIANGANGTPDLRGEFIRGLDLGRGIDTGRVLSSNQDHDWKGFTAYNVGRNTTTNYSHGPVYMGKSLTTYVGNIFAGAWTSPAASIGIMWDSSEIRPRNVALLYCMKN